MKFEETLLHIGNHLRFVLFGLQCAANVEFNPAEVERLYDEASEPTVAEKDYTFWYSSGLRVTGRVDEHEPETVWVRVESRKPLEPSLSVIEELARYQVYHIRRRQNDDPL